MRKSIDFDGFFYTNAMNLQLRTVEIDFLVLPKILWTTIRFNDLQTFTYCSLFNNDLLESLHYFDVYGFYLVSGRTRRRILPRELCNLDLHRRKSRSEKRKC
jgi:hypothetical protein